MPRDAEGARVGASIPPGATGAEQMPLGARKVATPTPIPASIPGAGGASPLSLSGTVRTALSLAGVVGVIVAVAYGFKRLSRSSGGLINQLGAGGRAPSGVLSVLGRYPVARGTTLVLLKADRRVLLLCQTAGKGLTGGCTMQTLSEFTDPEDVASILLKARDEEEATLAQRFESILSREDRTATQTLGPTSSTPDRSAAPSARANPSRAPKVAARQPGDVLRPTMAPSDPRAQIAREPVAAKSDRPAQARGPVLRGVVA